jgi:hypothetical protein
MDSVYGNNKKLKNYLWTQLIEEERSRWDYPGTEYTQSS